MTFHFFTCSTHPAIYLITDRPEIPDNVSKDLCKSGYWVLDRKENLLRDVVSGFSEEYVENDIKTRGYSVIRWIIDPSATKKQSAGK